MTPTSTVPSEAFVDIAIYLRFVRLDPSVLFSLVGVSSFPDDSIRSSVERLRKCFPQSLNPKSYINKRE